MQLESGSDLLSGIYYFATEHLLTWFKQLFNVCYYYFKFHTFSKKISNNQTLSHFTFRFSSIGNQQNYNCIISWFSAFALVKENLKL